MRLRRYLTEEYFGSFHHLDRTDDQTFYTEVFKNPTRKEMLDASKTRGLGHDPSGRNVRFYIDMQDKDLYVWSPFSFHTEAADVIANNMGVGGDSYEFMNSRAIPGVATFKGGKWQMIASDELDHAYGVDGLATTMLGRREAEKMANDDWSSFDWLKAIDVRPFFKRMLGDSGINY
jgi:hypothetical protein